MRGAYFDSHIVFERSAGHKLIFFKIKQTVYIAQLS